MKEIIFIYDYNCPYCYLMLPEIERLYAEHMIKVNCIPIEIHPEIPPEGINKNTFLGVRMVEKTNKLVSTEVKIKNLVFYSPEIIYNTRLARLLTAYAMDKVPMEEILHTLYHSVFIYNDNIGALEVIRKICIHLGISFEDFSLKVEQGELETIIKSWQNVLNHYPILVVPTIASSENILVEGVCSYEELVKMINE